MFNFLKHFLKKPLKVSVPVEPKPRKITSDIDFAMFYAGYDFQVNKDITMRQPTVGEIVELIGESRYYHMVHSLTSIPSDHISELWDKGIDFQKVNNLTFLYMMTRGLDQKDSSLIFGDNLDFDKFELYTRGKEVVMYDKDSDIVLDTVDCDKISQVVCAWNGIKKEPITAAGPMAFRAMVEIDRQEKLELSTKRHKSSMVPMLSSAVNHEGFKYNLEETLGLKIFFFIDCISRIGVRVSTDRIAFGYYSGSFDTKKFKPEKQLNWMRDLYS
jgi:hypothetical protein